MKKKLLNQRKTTQLLISFCFMLFMNLSWGQQVIGSFPYMNGGFEGQTAATLGTTVSPSLWSRQSQSGASSSITSTSPRTGLNSSTVTNVASSSRGLQSPQLTPFDAAKSPTASTQYMVQFWVRNAAGVTNFQVGTNTNGTANTGYTTSTFNLPINSSWTKYTMATTTSSTAVTSSGIAVIGKSTAGTFDIDDVVIYPGSTADGTAPDAPTSPTIPSAAATQQTISWTAPTTNTADIAGYMVVRSSADPQTIPNPNGIYAIGNFVAGTEKVVYLGTAASFIDLGLSPTTTYYYRIYTVDRAFNYSATSIAISGTTSAPSYATEPTAQASGISFANVTSTGFDVTWTGGNGSNSLVVIRSGSAVNADPSDGNTYSPNAAFGTGTQLGTGNYSVYNSTGNSVTITGLTKAITYYVKVYTFNGSGGSENYLTTNPASGTQMALPGEISSNGTGGGNWTTGSTWTGGVVPTQYDNVTILGNDIITFTASGRCYNLTIPTNTKVWAPAANTLLIYGTSLSCAGTFGDASNVLTTGSQLTVEFGENLTISGAGGIYPFKIRPIAGLSNIGITFNSNTTVTNTTVCIQSDNGSNDNVTYTVNSGKTLTLGGSLSTTSSSSGVGSANTNVNVNGTLNIGGSGTLNTTVVVGKTYAVNINGDMTINKLNITPAHAVQSPSITVTAPGSLTVTGTVDASNTTVAGAVTGTGTFTHNSGGTIQIAAATGLEPVSGPIRTTTRNFSTGANYQYVGNVAQVSGGDLPATINNLSINNVNGVTLGTATTVAGVLAVNAGTFNTGDLLTLKSDATATARVATVFGSITGKATVERYIPAKRGWRALTAPVVGSTNATVFNNWQNNGTVIANTGVEIWSNASSHASVTNAGGASSLLSYNSAGDSWTPITNTSTAPLFTSTINNPFMVFVTGPYATTSTNITSGTAATTLKAQGTLLTGTQTYPSAATEYTFIGNPYASPLNLSLMLADTENAAFGTNIWVWDANVAGTYSVGTYNLFDSTASNYTNITSNTGISGAQIQSGQAFFVKSTLGGTFSIKEAHKGSTFSNAVFRDAAPAELLRVGLYKQINTEWSGRDGAMTVITADAEANQVANKMANGTENVAFTKNGLLFASEHHLPLVASDVLNVRVWNTTAGANYKLKINTEQFITTNLDATLEDLFTNSRTPIALDGTAVEYPFSVTTETASSGNRFRIVFENSALGINNPKASEIRILPNPITGDTFQVNLGTLSTGDYSYSICNTLGQEVEKGNINNEVQNTNYTVKLKNSTAAGMYIMKVTGTDNTVFTAKLIKK